MRNKIIGALMICLLAATTKIYASAPKIDDGFENVINRYINSIIKSDYQELNNVLGENLRFEIPHMHSLMIFRKSTIVDDMKSRDGRRQDFKPDYVVLAQSEAVSIVQIDFKYGDTIMQNFVFLERNQEDEWKISEVYELFKTADNTNSSDRIAVSK